MECYNLVVDGLERHPMMNYRYLRLSSLQQVKVRGKADHARMGVGGVLISLTLAVSP